MVLPTIQETSIETDSTSYQDPTIPQEITTEFAIAQQTGYKQIQNKIVPIHERNEDVYYADGRVFILADGHGGDDASKWFVKESKERVYSLINMKQWDFKSESSRQEFEKLLKEMYEEMDHDFKMLKRQQYESFMDTGFSKPIEDGCTLIVNVILNGYFINCNVGDSRTILGAYLESTNFVPSFPIRDFETKYSQKYYELQHGMTKDSISYVYGSSDHNMTHPHKIQHIMDHGGCFITNVVPIKFHQVSPAYTRNYKPYSELIGTRIYNPSPKERNVSNRRTLNLSSTMGDIVFKPCISSEPDVRFIKLEQGILYAMIMGSDGVWDHLHMQSSQDNQNEQMLNYLNKKLSTVSMDEFCKEMVNREQGLYVSGLSRVDDVTFMCAKIQV